MSAEHYSKPTKRRLRLSALDAAVSALSAFPQTLGLQGSVAARRVSAMQVQRSANAYTALRRFLHKHRNPDNCRKVSGRQSRFARHARRFA